LSGWVDGAASDEHAAIADEQIRDIVAAAPAVYHRRGRIIPHAACPEKMGEAFATTVQGFVEAYVP
jgi:hypothetical protein